MKKPSETDWTRIDAMEDEDIDTSDIPPLDDTFFANATLRLPGNKVSVTVDVDADVLEWFKAQGEEFQNRINAALRIYAEAHKEQRR
ncbi:MAG TPA: BrnA antitoxin family protein [Pyrinomonadaceae bacterium]